MTRKRKARTLWVTCDEGTGRPITAVSMGMPTRVLHAYTKPAKIRTVWPGEKVVKFIEVVK